MTKEEMIAEIQRFIDQYDGTTIGYSIKNKLDNADNIACNIQYRKKPISAYICLSKDAKNKNIECLGLSPDIIEYLHEQRIMTINDLLNKSLDDLSETQNINPMACNLIIPKLMNYNNNKGE